MAAPAEQIWSVVSDITNTGKFSPETFAAEWLDGATGPAVGTRFRGHVKRNGRGTDVTESFELPDHIGTRIYWAIAGSARGRTNRNGMRQTLERIKAVVE
jgi:hypothetical protein